jgi:hypothetical protein
MTVDESQALEEMLRLVAEASERARRAAQESEGAAAEAFAGADMQLRRLYKQLIDGTILCGGEAFGEQLQLGAAA